MICSELVLGTWVGLQAKDGTARLWYSLTGECIKTFAGHNDGVVSAIFAKSSKSVLTASVDRTAKAGMRKNPTKGGP